MSAPRVNDEIAVMVGSGDLRPAIVRHVDEASFSAVLHDSDAQTEQVAIFLFEDEMITWAPAGTHVDCEDQLRTAYALSGKFVTVLTATTYALRFALGSSL